MKTAARISSNRFAIAAIALLLAAPGCSRSDFNVVLKKSAPVLSNLRVSASSSTLTLSAPAFQDEGNPKPTVEAFYAVSGVMGDDAPDVSRGERWEINLSGDTTLSGLQVDTAYQIVVVAENELGRSIKTTTVTTNESAPKLNGITPTSTSSSITVYMPVFSTAPNPALTSLKAYIYKTGAAVTFSEGVPYVGGSQATSVDLQYKGTIRGCTFGGLDANTAYTVRVVAVNPAGSSYVEGIISTAMTPPVLAPLSVSVSSGTVSVAPTLANTGNPPVATVNVYIGKNLSINGSSVSGAIASSNNLSQQSSSGPYSEGDSVMAAVVAQNAAGYSIKTAEVTIPNGSDPSFIWLALDGVYGKIYSLAIVVNAPFIASLQPVVTYGVLPIVTVTNNGSSFASGSPLGFSGPVSLVASLSTTADYAVSLTSYGRVSTPVSSVISAPYGITTDGVNLYVLDRNEIHRIPEATMSGTVIAGGSSGYADGDGTAAKFYGANGIVYSEGYLYVADTWNNRIRRVMTSAPFTVTTLAGSGTAALSDGTGAAASFNLPYGIAAGGSGILYVADTVNNVIRKVSTSTGAVTTLAGTGTAGSANGAFSDATFNNPGALVLVGSTLFVCDTGSHRIRALDLTAETVTTFAGSSAGYADDVGTAAKFCKLRGITSDGTNLFVSESDSTDVNYDGSTINDPNAKVRKIFLSGARVTTVAGSTVSGIADGEGTAATFYDLFGIVYLNNALYVTDPTKNLIRKIE